MGQIFTTWYMFIYLLIIIGVFESIFALVLEQYKFTLAGKALIGLTFFSLVVLFVYELNYFYMVDEIGLISQGIGAFEVLLLTHPYIFLILAILLGGEKRPVRKSKKFNS
ncbi:hypothetical protein HCJ45_00490 [Listeria sp. FSL L7-1517]|uniref:hypothetical protein n=1 Tax=Listeria immobilis TaxID=2713502 RepID=UPI00164CF41E|nr:hypothetical protein [Listeria immobilis]MBC6295599.1 hypothetical protein [Listeria immobilis]